MNWWTQLKTFFSEVRSEMAKVTFPTRDEVVATTIVVVVTSFLFAFYLWLADMAILKGYEWIVKAFNA